MACAGSGGRAAADAVDTEGAVLIDGVSDTEAVPCCTWCPLWTAEPALAPGAPEPEVSAPEELLTPGKGGVAALKPVPAPAPREPVELVPVAPDVKLAGGGT